MKHQSNKKLQSSFEKNFITKNTIKRNKRYFDINQIKSLENSRSISRRKPFPSHHSTQAKIKNSFMNTTGILSDRQQNTSFIKQRNSLDLNMVDNQTTTLFHQQINPDDIFRPKTAFEQKKTKTNRKNQGNEHKGFSMDKMTSRQYYFTLRNKPCPDQRLFNNYSQIKPKSSRTRGFEKQLNRSLDFAHHHTTDLNYNSQKQYQFALYDQTVNKCQLNYKIQDKKQGRFYFKPQRPQNLPSTDLDVQKVRKSYQTVSTTGVDTIIPFYNTSGRQLPHQIEIRQMTPLKDHWHVQGEIPRPALDYGQRKMKKDMVEERINNIKERKKVKFERQELCDDKYFQVCGIRRSSRNGH